MTFVVLEHIMQLVIVTLLRAAQGAQTVMEYGVTSKIKFLKKGPDIDGISHYLV